MLEAGWAFLVLLAMAAATAVMLVPWAQLLDAGQMIMLASASVGIPMEAIYFSLLGFALTRTGHKPRGWYWASFNHHHLLTDRARMWVLPWFYVGALAFACIVLGMLVVGLGVVAAV